MTLFYLVSRQSSKLWCRVHSPHSRQNFFVWATLQLLRNLIQENWAISIIVWLIISWPEKSTIFEIILPDWRANTNADLLNALPFTSAPLSMSNFTILSGPTLLKRYFQLEHMPNSIQQGTIEWILKICFGFFQYLWMRPRIRHYHDVDSEHWHQLPFEWATLQLWCGLNKTVRWSLFVNDFNMISIDGNTSSDCNDQRC